MLSMRPALWMTAAFLLGISFSYAEDSDKTDASSPTPTPVETPSRVRKAVVRQPTPEEDIRATRQMMEEQALKIEAISQQVSKIVAQMNALSENTRALNARSGEAPVTTATPSSSASPNDGLSSNPTAAPAAQAISTGNNPTHIVAKGETLTSIARHSKVTVAELLKLNKIENDRALQIGQTLFLPTPKPLETPANNEPK